uniref:C2 PI3K-type domain-containing protein n=1 Tax=Timema cristinae TaxID=61476 RepID=A0A7R9D2K4_TIMCR|nr:unnamed protein product [Timema cristinae]
MDSDKDRDNDEDNGGYKDRNTGSGTETDAGTRRDAGKWQTRSLVELAYQLMEPEIYWGNPGSSEGSSFQPNNGKDEGKKRDAWGEPCDCRSLFLETRRVGLGLVRALCVKMEISGCSEELYINPLAWVNTTVYDFKNQLKTGAMTLYMWTYVEDIQTDDLLHPLGTVVSNPNVQHTTTLTLTFHRYHLERTVMYPSLETVLQFAAANSETSLDAPLVNQPNLYLEQLLSMQEKDPLH